MKETDLYAPLKTFLESQGYEVKGEVEDCDVVAIRGEEEPVIVELKRSLGFDVLLQAIDRLAISSKVYVGVPWGTPTLKRRRRAVLRLFRMTGLGLIVVDPARSHGNVDVLLDPGDYRPRRSRKRSERLLREFATRVGDPEAGGADRRKGLLTAYRQRAIRIASWLAVHGATKASEVAAANDEPDARNILYRNVYGWFDRTERGVYDLSPRGERELEEWIDS